MFVHAYTLYSSVRPFGVTEPIPVSKEQFLAAIDYLGDPEAAIAKHSTVKESYTFDKLAEILVKRGIKLRDAWGYPQPATVSSVVKYLNSGTITPTSIVDNFVNDCKRNICSVEFEDNAVVISRPKDYRIINELLNQSVTRYDTLELSTGNYTLGEIIDLYLADHPRQFSKLKELFVEALPAECLRLYKDNARRELANLLLADSSLTRSIWEKALYLYNQKSETPIALSVFMNIGERTLLTAINWDSVEDVTKATYSILRILGRNAEMIAYSEAKEMAFAPDLLHTGWSNRLISIFSTMALPDEIQREDICQSRDTGSIVTWFIDHEKRDQLWRDFWADFKAQKVYVLVS